MSTENLENFEEIDDLKKGYQKFRQKYFVQNNELYKKLVEEGQQPRYLVVACSDSRVDPSIILSCKPGDLFVVRNVANLIPPYEIDSHYHGTSAALEFGICGLGIKEIIILGHSQCGGILSLLKEAPKSPNSFISKWMELAQITCQVKVDASPQLSLIEKANICGRSAMLGSLQNLKTFPWIMERLNSKELLIHIWYFDLETGIIYSYNETAQDFQPLV